uniref:Uncharacterized protein n=1 Tax=Romanomermis culicivorax TaxID=13658 RepID=A0A915JSD9_ROMCU
MLPFILFSYLAPVALICLSVIAGILSIIVIIIAIIFYLKQEKILGQTFQSADLLRKHSTLAYSRKQIKPTKESYSKLSQPPTKKILTSVNNSNFKPLDGFQKSSDIDWNSFASTKKTTQTLSPTPSGGTSSLSPSASPRISSTVFTMPSNLTTTSAIAAIATPTAKKATVVKKNKFERKSVDDFIDTRGDEGGVAASLIVTQESFFMKGKKNDL